jgi:hypothetical protein
LFSGFTSGELAGLKLQKKSDGSSNIRQRFLSGFSLRPAAFGDGHLATK